MIEKLDESLVSGLYMGGRNESDRLIGVKSINAQRAAAVLAQVLGWRTDVEIAAA